MKCEFCEDKRIAFTCEKCESSYCINHTISTEQWQCKFHNQFYSKMESQKLNNRCFVVEKSSCPECRSPLLLEKSASGQFHLKCTDSKCAWNSFLKTPSIFDQKHEEVLRKARVQGLIKSSEICRRKLRKIEGKEICPKCFLAVLRSAAITNLGVMSTMFNISNEDVIKIIRDFMRENKVFGIIDKVHELFYYINQEIKEKVLSKIDNEGNVDIYNLSTMLDMSSDNIIKLILKIIKEYKIKGSFTKKREKYYTQQYILDKIIDIINTKGRIYLDAIGEELDLPTELVKTFFVNLMKLEKINAYFADKGSEILTRDQLNKDLSNYLNEKGLFKLQEAANDLKVALELGRRTLYDLTKSGDIKGVFTQRREFMSQKFLEDKIKEITRVYRKITIVELAKRLGITESNIEEKLALLISSGALEGYIDSQNKTFFLERVSPVSSSGVKLSTDESNLSMADISQKIEILREYDFMGGQLHFKVVVRNHSEVAIHSIKVILDAPSSYKHKQEVISIPVLEPGNSRGVDFFLEPRECGLSSIGGTVIYKNPRGEAITLNIRKKEVQIKCPLVCTNLDTIEDCQMSIQSLPSDARAFLIADIDPRLAFRAAQRTLKSFDTRAVTSHEKGQDDDYKAEAWYCAEAKVTGGRIITRIYIEAKNQSLEIRVWCGNSGQLTGFLAKIIEILFEQINTIRKIRSEEREKTLDVMVITQNIMEISDYAMLKWKARNIRIKLQDTFVRIRNILGEKDPVLDRIEFWLTTLNKYNKEDNISEEDAKKLVDDVEHFKNVMGRAIKI